MGIHRLDIFWQPFNDIDLLINFFSQELYTLPSYKGVKYILSVFFFFDITFSLILKTRILSYSYNFP
jgi:hypothetical protein